MTIRVSQYRILVLLLKRTLYEGDIRITDVMLSRKPITCCENGKNEYPITDRRFCNSVLLMEIDRLGARYISPRLLYPSFVPRNSPERT